MDGDRKRRCLTCIHALNDPQLEDHLVCAHDPPKVHLLPRAPIQGLDGKLRMGADVKGLCPPVSDNWSCAFHQFPDEAGHRPAPGAVAASPAE